MAITTHIHSIDESENSAVISLSDGDRVIINKKNVSVELNQDGSVDTTRLNEFSRKFVLIDRLKEWEKIEEDLL